MGIASELIDLVEHIASKIDIPPIAWIYIPEPRPDPHKAAEFGAVVLEDGSTGFFYAWLGESQQGMPRRFKQIQFTGSSPLKFVEFFRENDDALRSIGLAMINAISQHFFRITNIELATGIDAMASMAFGTDDHVGMVGYFPSLMKRLATQGIRVSVVERKTHLVASSDTVEISLNPAVLAPCNKILCTGATLLNDTLEEILGECCNAGQIAIIGPTASCIPDSIFRRGVDIIGGAVVVDAKSFTERLPGGGRWGRSATKYRIEKTTYLGVEYLLERLLD